MSQQLTLSSLFCALALASLGVVTAAREIGGARALVIVEQAEVASGLFHR